MEGLSRQCWFINFKSGHGDGERLAQALTGVVTVVPIDFAHLSAQLRSANAFEKIVVAGGDGTCAAVLTSMDLPDVPVAVVPLGTANDLARELGTMRALAGKAWQEYPQVVDALKETVLSVWEFTCGDRLHSFCNYISLGFEGAVVGEFDAWRSRTQCRNPFLNRLIYVYFGLKCWFVRLKGVRVANESGTPYLCPSTRGVLFANIRSHMGCGVATDESQSSDDVLECVIASSPLDYLRMVLSPYKLLPTPRSVVRGRELRVSGLPLGTPIQIDGEASPRLSSDEAVFRIRSFVRVLSR